MVKALDGSVIDEDTVTVTVNTIKVNAGDDVTFNELQKIKLTASRGEIYLWGIGETSMSIIVSTSITETYEVIVLSSAVQGGITTTDSIVVTVENCDLLFDTRNDFQKKIEVFPDSSSDVLNVRVTSIEKELNLVLINTSGSIVYSGKMDFNYSDISRQIDLSGLAKGVYFVGLFKANQSVVKKHFISKLS